MTDMSSRDVLEAVLDAFMDWTQDAFDERWDAYLKPASLTNAGEVMAGLLARQIDLAQTFAKSPVMWELTVAPIVLRTMIETHINLAWIVRDPVPRADSYIDYGLGQAKLMLEQRKVELEAMGAQPEEDDLFRLGMAWLEVQRYAILTTVTVGSWENIRQMADEVGLGRLYRLSYVPFSAAVHSQWFHIARCNLTFCENPLHGGHRIPGWRTDPWIGHLRIAAKYLTLTLAEADQSVGYVSTTTSPVEWLELVLNAAADALTEDGLSVGMTDTLADGVVF